MLCKDKITSIFCIINDILKEINHSEDIPPLAQACSLSHHSQPSQPSQLSHIKKICTLSKVKHKQYTNDTGRPKDSRTISED